jgi:hypothetical protein
LIEPPLGSFRVLGDGRCAALVATDASIPWWCAPSFDAAPAFWSLLDPGGAGASFAGARPCGRDEAPAGPTARTTIEVACGRVEVRDGLLDGALIRLVRGTSGELDVVHRCSMGGFDGDGQGPWHEHRLVAPANEWRAIKLSPDGASTADPREWLPRLDEARSRFLERQRDVRVPRRHAQRVRDSIDVMRVCTFEPTGAVVAAVTTSLPEAPGHDRQFDYRYAWLRDTALAAGVAALVGRPELAQRSLHFLSSTLGARLLDAPVFTVDGGQVPDEREMLGAAGRGGSRPVRVGNAAKEQRQNDALGFVVEAISVHLQEGGALDPELWRMVCDIADRLCEPDEEETNGIWELRTPARLLSADIGRWMALDRAIWIARGWRPTTRRAHWIEARRRCRTRVLAELRSDGRLPREYGGDPDDLDASALLIVILHMLDRRDPRARALVETHLERLGHGPWIYRYQPRDDDGFSGIEGAFLPCSWWAVSALAGIGLVDAAKERADQLCASSPRLLAEEVDPKTEDLLGNVPLVWSHMEMARALYLLDVADRRRRWGFLGFHAWRLAHLALARLRPQQG